MTEATNPEWASRAECINQRGFITLSQIATDTIVRPTNVEMVQCSEEVCSTTVACCIFTRITPEIKVFFKLVSYCRSYKQEGNLSLIKQPGFNRLKFYHKIIIKNKPISFYEQIYA